jgi:hypothetical protein
MLAIAYNVISIYRLSNGNPPLKEGNPELTLYFLFPYALLIALGYFQNFRAYFIVGAVLTLLLFIIGVLSHIHTVILPGGMQIYSSQWSWLFAILINIFGVLAFQLGLLKTLRALLESQ